MALILATTLAAGCAGPEMAAEPGQSHAAPEAIVSRGDFERELLLTGELEAVRSISIKSPQTSIFQMRIQFMAEEGTAVKKGDPILDFDNSSLADRVRELETQILDAEMQIVAKRNELASAMKDLEIQVAERQFEHDRAKVEATIDEAVLSRKEYNERQLTYEKSARELDEIHERIAKTRKSGKADLDVLIIDRDKLRKDLISAENDLEHLSLKAPAEGIVVYEKRRRSTLRFQEGDSCWPGQSIIQLPDLSEMQVEFTVNEVDAPLLEVGVPVRISLDAFPGRELLGEIKHIPSMAVKPTDDSKIAVFRVKASLHDTWVGEMKPGMSVLGRVVVERRENVPLVARHSVRFDGTGYRLQEGPDSTGATDGRTIQPIARNASHYVISEEEYARLGGEPDPSGRRISSVEADSSGDSP
jgi:multidrug efflux pump subunit AcrA (membrane-fusion protein)